MILDNWCWSTWFTVLRRGWVIVLVTHAFCQTQSWIIIVCCWFLRLYPRKWHISTRVFCNICRVSWDIFRAWAKVSTTLIIAYPSCKLGISVDDSCDGALEISVATYLRWSLSVTFRNGPVRGKNLTASQYLASLVLEKNHLKLLQWLKDRPTCHPAYPFSS